ncbi:uncharacterized protein LOC143150688 [Ptiloglossa arizonensis]|uniref:uncharacterized protein LOC143150688 n=1 Tax=Ptiloglossa arizonensis TaxID=3350558 RepID=UPI003F9FE2DB
MKTQSVSVQNLENVVKQIVNEALEDNEQVIKFHQMIYEEWYFKKLLESKDTARDENETKSLEDNEQNISATVAHRRSRRYKYKRQRSRSSIDIDSTRDHIVSNNSKIWRVQSLFVRNSKQPLNIDSEDESTDKSINIVSNNSIQQYHQIIDHKNVQDNTKVTEIWNNSFKRSNKSRNKTNAALKGTRTLCSDNRPPRKQRSVRQISFEAWKERKTMEYRQLLKQVEYEKQQQLLANLENIKREKIIQQERARKRQQQQRQRNQKLSKKYIATINQTNVITESNFNAPGKQKVTQYDKDKKRLLSTR